MVVRKRALIAIASVLALLLAVPASAGSGRFAPGSAIELQGTLGDAPYRVKVPASWNGTLLVFAHGYGRSATQPIPITPNYGSAGQEQFFLDRGYALAASAYSRPGWAVKEGIQETLALTNWFKGHVAMPETTILWGRSMGSVVTMESLERFPGAYDGVISMCAVGAGSARAFDGATAVAVAYDAAFGWPAAWGPIDDVRDDLSFNADVVPVLVGQLLNPANIGKFEFLRLVSRLPATGFYTPPTALEAPFLFQVMFFVTEGRAELERRAGGIPVQNLNHSYTLGAAEQAYLAALGVNANALLASMNAKRTIAADQNARNWLEHYASYTGAFSRPEIGLWGINDGLVPASHASAYRETVQDASLYLDGFASAPGHCNYSDEQLLETVTKMESWIATGVKPTPLSAPGIVPGYVPAPFPVP